MRHRPVALWLVAALPAACSGQNGGVAAGVGGATQPPRAAAILVSP